MSDARTRDLERRARAGDYDAAALLAAARRRQGERTWPEVSPREAWVVAELQALEPRRLEHAWDGDYAVRLFWFALETEGPPWVLPFSRGHYPGLGGGDWCAAEEGRCPALYPGEGPRDAAGRITRTWIRCRRPVGHDDMHAEGRVRRWVRATPWWIEVPTLELLDAAGVSDRCASHWSGLRCYRPAFHEGNHYSGSVNWTNMGRP